MDEHPRNCVIDEAAVGSEQVLLRQTCENRYGSVPGLDDNELLGPEEIERMVSQQEWGPILELPVKGRKYGASAGAGESVSVGFGAFETVDFDRVMPEFDRAMYKADKLKERLKDLLITISIVSGRLPGAAKYRVLKYLRMGIIDTEHIVSPDMQALARLNDRARKLRTEIVDLQESSQRRQEKKAKAWWDSLCEG